MTISQLIDQLKLFHQEQSNALVCLHSSAEVNWIVYIRYGRIIWANSTKHRFRRWYRVMSQHCPHINSESVKLREREISDLWEYLVLTVLIKRKQLEIKPAVAVIEAAVGEILFDLFQASATITNIEYITETSDPKKFSVLKNPLFKDPIAYLNVEQSIQKAQQLWQSWSEAHLSRYSPDFAPKILNPQQLEQLIGSKTYQKLVVLLDGNHTLRDIAILTKQNLVMTTRSFAVYIDKGAIAFEPIPDISAPVVGPPIPTASQPPNQERRDASNNPNPYNRPLIVCIDDSPEVGRLMEKILSPVGYKVLAIQDSITALTLLIEHKPQLIFLDLIMPVANGYEICSQIRRVSSLRDIPVVIVTGNDGIVDRVRAKVAGASEFTTKPIEADKIIALANRYIKSDHSAVTSNPTQQFA